MTRLHRIAARLGITDTPTHDELAARVEELQAQVDELTARIDHPTWPEPYRHQRATEAFNRLTQR